MGIPGDDWTAEYFKRLVEQQITEINSPDIEMQEQAISELERFAEDSEIVPALLHFAEPGLLPALHHENPIIRSGIAQVLCRIWGKKAVEPIAGLLMNEDSAVSIWAAANLDELDDSRGIEYIQQLWTTADAQERLDIFQVLGVCYSDQANDFILNVMESDPNPEVRLSAMYCLEERLEPRAIRLFIAMCFDKDQAIRTAARDMDTWIANPEFKDLLLELVQNGNPNEQMMASRALAEIIEDDSASS